MYEGFYRLNVKRNMCSYEFCLSTTSSASVFKFNSHEDGITDFKVNAVKAFPRLHYVLSRCFWQKES